MPTLNNQPSCCAIGFQIDDSLETIPDQHRQSEVAILPLVLGHVGFEQVLLAKEGLSALALTHQRIEGR